MGSPILYKAAPISNKCLFHGLFSIMYFAIFGVPSVGDFNSSKEPQSCNVQVLSGFLVGWQALICSWRKCLLDKLHSGISECYCLWLQCSFTKRNFTDRYVSLLWERSNLDIYCMMKLWKSQLKVRIHEMWTIQMFKRTWKESVSCLVVPTLQPHGL